MTSTSHLPKLCRHFGTCGGCRLQDIPDTEYRARLHEAVAAALTRHGLDPSVVAAVEAVAPGTRRRATFKIARRDGTVSIGFHAAASHDIVDMRECRVLRPSLVALVSGLRDAMLGVLRDGESAELFVMEADNGFDGALHWRRAMTTALLSDVARWAPKLGFVRLTSGNETLLSLDAPGVRLGRATVQLPPEAFLQPTREGEAILQAQVREAVAGAKTMVDLFSGCGTFALPLAERASVHAVELDRAMADALGRAARAAAGLKPVTVESRDLFKHPLSARELERFDAAVLDPPRAGAVAQARELAASRLRRIAYVSCDAQSFARDARLLVDGGFRLARVVPVDQFLWSGHIELAASFERPKRQG